MVPQPEVGPHGQVGAAGVPGEAQLAGVDAVPRRVFPVVGAHLRALQHGLGELGLGGEGVVHAHHDAAGGVGQYAHNAVVGLYAAHGEAAAVEVENAGVGPARGGVKNTGEHFAALAGHAHVHGLVHLGAALVPEAALLHVVGPDLGVAQAHGVEGVLGVLVLVAQHLQHLGREVLEHLDLVGVVHSIPPVQRPGGAGYSSPLK